MEWNWCGNENNWISFLLSESSGDSEDVKSDVHHDHHHDNHHHDHDEVVGDDMEGVLLRFNHGDVVDDDAQSCSYDHSSYSNTRYGNSDQHDQSQRLIFDDDHDHDDDDDDDGDIDDDGDYDDDDGDYDDDDDDKNKNLCERKMMDSSKQEWRSHKSCGDSNSNQREIDRKFWEACLAS